MWRSCLGLLPAPPAGSRRGGGAVAALARRPPRLRRAGGADTALKRFGQSREVATVIRFLLSDNSSCITGQVINVDGVIDA